MTDNTNRIQWAPKVPRHKIRRLYENDARGILDETLIDEVGYALYARCESVWMVTERRCPECKEKCQRSEEADPILSCPNCGWSTSWKAYKRSYKGKRIHGGRAYEFFLTYMDEFLRARGPREKMLAIDRVIHALHESANQVWTLPASVNLIEGTFQEVIAFLDDLAYGDTTDASMPACEETRAREEMRDREEMRAREEMRDRKEQWRRKIAEGARATEQWYADKAKRSEGQ